MPLLSMEDISISFFGAYANHHVDLTVEPNEIHALLGENGAGKTTLMNVLFGIYRPESGRIVWDGKETRFSSPQEAINAGIGMVHQHFSLVNAATVLDNILLGSPDLPAFLPRKQLRRRIVELSERYGLKVDPDARVGDLSIGEKQRVEILKALYRDIRLLILDEPTAVLTPGESEQLFSVLRLLKAGGFSVILITHHMNEIMGHADRVTVLRNGQCAGTRVISEASVQELTSLMVGRGVDAQENPSDSEPGEALLTLSGLSVFRSGRRRPALENVSLEVRAGEIVGIAGVEGNGQKELAEAIAGIRRRRVKGTIVLDGMDLTGTNVSTRTRLGMAYVPDDRQHDALVTAMDVGDNLLLHAYRSKKYSRGRLLRRNVINQSAKAAIETYSIRTTGNLGARSPVRLLSGGNQQKIVIAREITESARFIVASQPTRGLDISASAFVHSKLLEQKALGKGVLLISADLDEIMRLSDRVAVLYNGRIVGIMDKKDATIERLGLLMGGGNDGGQREAEA